MTERHSGDEDTDESEVLPEHTVVGAGAQLKAASEALGPGTVLDERYQIEAALGEGGAGTVYRAWDRMLGEAVAVKILRPERACERSWIRRLAREVKLARAIRHPNVCRVFELGHADGHWYITMELAEGGTLRDQLRAPGAASGGRPLAERLLDARAICAGLGAMHALGITHRDVTPQNVLRMKDGRLVLSDFGLAVENTDATTVYGGTPAYMPPEVVIGGRSDQRSDVWQLGAILHELLFGRRPEWVDGARAGAAGMVIKPPVGAAASRVEEELALLCGLCLDPNPGTRPASAIAVAGLLTAAETAKPRSWPARVWVRTKALHRAYPRVRMAIAALVVMGATAKVVQVATRPPLCENAHERLVGVWDGAVKGVIQAAFLATGKPYAKEAVASITRALDDYARRWTGMYRDACQATHVRGEQSAEVLDLRMACLNDGLGEVQALTRLFAHPDELMVGKAVEAVDVLPSVERCAEVARLKDVIPPPTDPATRRQVEGLRGRVREARALFETGQYAAARPLATGLLEEVQRTGYLPLVADTAYLAGRLELEAGEIDLSARRLERAFLAAQASRHDERAADAAVMVVAAFSRKDSLDQARHWVELADSAILRLGKRGELLRSWLLNEQGLMDGRAGRLDAAVEKFTAGLRIKERLFGPDSVDAARSLLNLGLAFHDAGRVQEALTTMERTIAIFTRLIGAEHPDIAIAENNRAEILNDLGRYPEAIKWFRKSLEIMERALPSDHPHLGYPLTGLGIAYLRTGRPDRAIPLLERALTVRSSGQRERAKVGETRFALAQALWDSERDRPRALRLVAEAQADFATNGGAHPKSAAAAKWLRDRRGGDMVIVANDRGARSREPRSGRGRGAGPSLAVQ